VTGMSGSAQCSTGSHTWCCKVCTYILGMMFVADDMLVHLICIQCITAGVVTNVPAAQQGK